MGTTILKTRLVAAVIAALLSGCAYFGGDVLGKAPGQRYQWFAVGPGTTGYVWHHVSRVELHNICNSAEPFLQACAKRNGNICDVYSTLSETKARSAFFDRGVDIREHELRHCGIETPDGQAYDHDND